MHDPSSSIWMDTIARLPAVTTLTLRIEPNVEPDREVSCMVCGRTGPCEWLAFQRSARQRFTAGLCEPCRLRSEASGKGEE